MSVSVERDRARGANRRFRPCDGGETLRGKQLVDERRVARRSTAEPIRAGRRTCEREGVATNRSVVDAEGFDPRRVRSHIVSVNKA